MNKDNPIVLVTDITGSQIKLPLNEARNYPFVIKIETIIGSGKDE